MQVVCEPDATPLVRIIAVTLRASLSDPATAAKAEKLDGVFTLKSEKDPQAVTMRFRKGTVALERGVPADAEVVVTVDLDNMSGPNAAKPKVQGAVRHPLFALAVSKLLEPPAQPWQQHAQAFWNFNAGRQHMPAGVRLVCLDSGATLDLGTAPAEFEIHGSDVELTAVFSGNAVFGQELLDGKIYAIGSLRNVSVLTGASIAFMMRDDA